MAITIVKQPQQLQPAYNEIIYVLSSTVANQQNFTFIAELEVDGDIVAVIRFPVNPDGYGVVDLHKHLQSFVTNDFDPTDLGFTEALKSYVKYKVIFKESLKPIWPFEFIVNYTVPPPGGPYPNTVDLQGYIGSNPNLYFSVGDDIQIVQDVPYSVPSYNGLTTIQSISGPFLNTWTIRTSKPFTAAPGASQTGIVTTPGYSNIETPNIVISINKEAFNGVRDFLNFIDWNYEDYDSNSATGSGKFLTEVYNKYKVRDNSKIWLHVYNSFVGELNYLKIQKGPLVYYLPNPLSSGGSTLFKVNVSPEYLLSGVLEDAAGDEPDFPLTLNDGDCYTLTVVENPLGADLVEPQTFCIENRCSRYEDIQLVFMDKLGSFIPFHFDLVNRHTKNIERVNYQQDYGKYAPASNNWKYNSWDRGTSSLDTKVTERYQITSNWVTQQQSDLLVDLIESPEVYWFKEDGTVVAINITDSSVERKQIINDQLINYTINFELANKNRQQSG